MPFGQRNLSKNSFIDAPEEIFNSLLCFFQFFGPAANMNETVLLQMGCITRALPFADLEKLPFLLETLEGFDHCGWNESQVMD